MALVRRGLVRSRAVASEAIRSGQVVVDGAVVTKPAAQIAESASVTVSVVAGVVSRGAHKLSGALADFGVSAGGLVALDAGACTGGFTEVLLNQGASRVYAVDVGHGQLAESLRSNPRVVDMPGVNLRCLDPDWLPERCSLVVADVSFISLTLVLPALIDAATPNADLVLLVKPQFEAGRGALDGRGVVRRAEDRAAAVVRVGLAAQEQGWAMCQVAPSRIVGGRGNREYFVHLRADAVGQAVPLSVVQETVRKDGTGSPVAGRPNAGK